MIQKLIFERLEEGKAFFNTKENKSISLPASFVDSNIKPGDNVFITISKEEDITKGVLNELLDPQK